MWTERLKSATKRTKTRNPSLTWKQARSLAWAWCTTMWPYDAYRLEAAATARKKAVRS